MFIFYNCKCGEAFGVPKIDENLHLLSLVMRCPDSSCSDKLRVCDAAKVYKGWKDLSAEDLFAACSGVGLPPEQQCSPVDLEMLLLGGIINAMELESSGSNPKRSIISNMVVGIDPCKEDSRAVKVHFAMSVHGATIYKVTDL